MMGQADRQEDPQTQRARTRIGMVLQDKWKLESLLGVGGMAAVYAATHRNGKRVAVKMLHEEFSHDEDVRMRFLQEGYAANTIQHEGAVSVLDDDMAPDGSAFLVMELLEGETVEQRWEAHNRRLPLDETLSMTDRLLDVLCAAHAKSVIHRDVKPDNLFVTRGGVLKVLDFGIAKVFEHRESRTTSTRAGTVMGTPAFMAPEQARARWDEVDARTDLWAVGATMFTLVSGRYVHQAAGAQEQLILSATTPAVPVADVAPGLPLHVAAIIDRALAFDRRDRWPDAGTMQRAVREALLMLEARSSPVSMGKLNSAIRSAAGTSSGGSTLVAGPKATALSISMLIRQREGPLLETQRLKAAVEDLERKRDASEQSIEIASEQLEAARAERKALEEWFNRRVGTRNAALGEARQVVRDSLIEIARRAMNGPSAFGEEIETLRNRVTTLERAAASAAEDATVHRTALTMHDTRVFRRGLIIVLMLLVVALVIPIVWRATRVIEPPIQQTVQPGR
jgi:eukaryotic-like serine/threonine-protein kinase